MRNVGKGRTAASVVLVGLNHENVGAIREVLATEAVLPSASVTFGDAIGVVKKSRPDVVIIGYSDARDAALALGQALTKEVPGTTLVALAERSDADEILAAMRAGFKEYVVLPEHSQRLRQAVHDAAFAPSDEEDKGLVIAVVGAKGGVGTTLLATHLAAELAEIHRVLCIDLDFSVGDVATLLNVTLKDTLMDLLPRADRLDERMLTGSVAVHKSKIHVLGQPNELERISDVRADDVYSIILAAARGYQYVIMDVGTTWDETSALALSVADLVLMVTTPDVISVRNAYRRLKLFEANGLERERVRLIVNRQTKTAFVKISDIEQNLQLPVSGVISEDRETVESAINEGKLLRMVNKKSEAARDISRLLAIVTDGEAPPPIEDTQKSKSLFASLFSRG